MRTGPCPAEIHPESSPALYQIIEYHPVRYSYQFLAWGFLARTNSWIFLISNSPPIPNQEIDRSVDTSVGKLLDGLTEGLVGPHSIFHCCFTRQMFHVATTRGKGSAALSAAGHTKSLLDYDYPSSLLHSSSTLAPSTTSASPSSRKKKKNTQNAVWKDIHLPRKDSPFEPQLASLELLFLTHLD